MSVKMSLKLFLKLSLKKVWSKSKVVKFQRSDSKRRGRAGLTPKMQAPGDASPAAQLVRRISGKESGDPPLATQLVRRLSVSPPSGEGKEAGTEEQRPRRSSRSSKERRKSQSRSPSKSPERTAEGISRRTTLSMRLGSEGVSSVGRRSSKGSAQSTR